MVPFDGTSRVKIQDERRFPYSERRHIPSHDAVCEETGQQGKSYPTENSGDDAE